MPQGTLFTEDFLNEGICGTQAWQRLAPDTSASFRTALRAIFAKIADPSRLNEPQTEERIIRPMLQALGWAGCYWVQERLKTKGRANVPDYLLFGSAEDFAKADRKRKATERYPLAIAVADANLHYDNWREKMAFIQSFLRKNAPDLPVEDLRVYLNSKPQGPYKLATILSQETERLLALDRYERRPLSRRKFAVRAFDEARDCNN